ncbi:glycosyltransferase family 4 protein [Acidocella sp.]|jgi:glycosyltransferase involved in cell wall biosynthesis|uniref:glycosyltransferase family 4 protein n=1 Tax=Acidocella sp. TaxID=50710 RepID=UPI002F3F7E54
MNTETAKPARILVFLVTEDWFFASHFWVRGLAAKATGWRVILIARESEATARLRASGIEVIPVAFVRRRLNPFAELGFALQLARLYRRIQPDLVHHVALKPIVVGGLAARLAGVKNIVNAPVGLGFVFSSDRLLARVLRPFVSLGLKLTLTPPGTRAIFENPDDLKVLSEGGMVRPKAAVLIRGAGVDIDTFAPAPEPAGMVRVILIARMIREKGVADFAAAARLLKGKAEFVLAGAPDPGNPDTVTEAELRGWEAEGLVTWLGPRRDVADLLRGAHIACQPSTFREGLPKSALEAMASGKPLVATDIPGGRETVVDGETGFLVPPRDPAALAAALERLIGDAALRARFGAAARRRAELSFSDPIICAQTLSVYDALVPRA